MSVGSEVCFPTNISFYTPSPPMLDLEDADGVDALERHALAASAQRDRALHASSRPANVAQVPQVNVVAMTQPTSNRRSRQNYTKAEILNLLRIVERVIPYDSDEWQAIADEHAICYAAREVDALKKKFA